MIDTVESKIGQAVKMTDLYDYLELEKANYSRFVKSNVVENPFFEQGKDYSSLVNSNNLGKKGQFRQDYYIHIDAAKKLCMVSKSAKGEAIRNELVKLTKQVEGGLMLSPQQVMTLVKLIKVFAVYEYRDDALKKNKATFVTDYLNANPKAQKSDPYIYFNVWRNSILGTGKEVLEQRLKEYCIIEQKAYKPNLGQDRIFSILGEYEHLRNAVWDLLSSKQKSEEFALNVANLAQNMAKEMKPFLERLNEANLFFEKIDKGTVNDVFLLEI